MTHGTRDWDQTAGGTTTYRLSDMAELAVRLGSIVTFDRRGEVIFLEDFEGTLSRFGWDAGGAGATVAMDASESNTGKQSVQLTAGSDNQRSAGIVKYLPLPVLSSVGQEFSFSVGSDIDELRVAISHFDGTRLIEFHLGWEFASQQLFWTDAGAVHHAIASGMNFAQLFAQFHTWKIVADLRTGELVRWLTNGSSYDLSGIAGITTPDATPPELDMAIELIGRGGHNDVAHVDSWIITQNEP